MKWLARSQMMSSLGDKFINQPAILRWFVAKV